MTINESNQKRALERILTALSPQNIAKGSARMLLYGTAVATIYAVAGGDPAAVAVASPIVGRLIETIGGNVLADFIDGVAQDKEEKLSAADIQRQVAELFAQVQPTDYLSETEFYRAMRILEERDVDRHQELLDKIEQIGQMLTQPDDEAALKIYLETVARQSGRLPLGSLDPSGSESSQLSLSQVFISLNAGETIVGTFTEPIEEESIWTRRAALGHICNFTHLILLGDPGSGKSTLLRYVAYLLAHAFLKPNGDWKQYLTWMESEGDIEIKRLGDDFIGRRQEKKDRETRRVAWPPPFPIPVLLNLRDLAATEFDSTSSTAIWEFVAGQLEKEDMAQATAALRSKGQQGKLLFLLDGVDEVPLTKRPHIWQAIQAHDAGAYGGNRWVTTCRILSFNADEAPKVPVKTIEPFDEAQIDDFIDHWYSGLHSLGELSQEKADNMGRQLKAAARRKGLRRLAPNPMLLTIMALVQTYYGTLPDERARLYQQCVETLLLRWQRHKEAAQTVELPDVLAQLGTTQENLERLLWEIAW
ncbi:hypothetical protein MNBD_CHLOROFLEXI01-2622 [hydrothermal vent metagenome]|uniref:NACHT domain-containing protein n=1 Tax=hydrothermal vent metagenome TaxID=652676 RepID=A0A3B0VUQ2_9ZZZZ